MSQIGDINLYNEDKVAKNEKLIGKAFKKMEDLEELNYEKWPQQL